MSTFWILVVVMLPKAPTSMEEAERAVAVASRAYETKAGCESEAKKMAEHFKKKLKEDAAFGELRGVACVPARK